LDETRAARRLQCRLLQLTIHTAEILQAPALLATSAQLKFDFDCCPVTLRFNPNNERFNQYAFLPRTLAEK
jgi:hypothetical protein